MIDEINGRWTCSLCGYEWSACISDDEVPDKCECETSKTDSLEFIRSYCDFSDPDCVWMLKGVTRSKDNEKGFHHFMRRLVMVTPDDIEPCYNDIKQMGNQAGTSYRIYVSLNSRNVIKGMFSFQKKLLDISHGVARGLDDMRKQTTKLGSVWKTVLEQRDCRGTKRILLDVDENDIGLLDDIVGFFVDRDVNVYVARPTVSGYTVVIDACDLREYYHIFEGRAIDVQKDSMVFVEKWDV